MESSPAEGGILNEAGQSPVQRIGGQPGRDRLYAAQSAFSTWPNSSSTGVERPKISTATRRRLFS